MIYSVTSKLNEEVAEELLRAIGDKNYFSGTVRVTSDDGVECCLKTSCVVYRRRCAMPEGEGEKIVSIVPVWWEFHTACAAGILDNDFSFRELNLENMD